MAPDILPNTEAVDQCSAEKHAAAGAGPTVAIGTAYHPPTAAVSISASLLRLPASRHVRTHALSDQDFSTRDFAA